MKTLMRSLLSLLLIFGLVSCAQMSNQDGGTVTGAVVGLVSSLTVGPIVARFTDERSGYVSGLTAGKGMTENLTERLSRPTWSLIGLILLAIAVLAALIYLAIQLA